MIDKNFLSIVVTFFKMLFFNKIQTTGLNKDINNVVD